MKFRFEDSIACQKAKKLTLIVYKLLENHTDLDIKINYKQQPFP